MARLEKHAVTEVHWPQLQPTVAAVTKKHTIYMGWGKVSRQAKLGLACRRQKKKETKPTDTQHVHGDLSARS